MTRTPVTAAELARQLQTEPAFLRQEAEREAARSSREKELRHASEPLLNDLDSISVHVTSIWDLVNTKDAFAEAQPVLFNHLLRDYPPVILEGIARSMSTTAARPYWKELVARFRTEDNVQVRDGVAVALAGIAGPDEFKELVELLKDGTLGTSRCLLIWTVGKRFPRDWAIEVLGELTHDPEIGAEASAALKKVLRRKR